MVWQSVHSSRAIICPKPRIVLVAAGKEVVCHFGLIEVAILAGVVGYSRQRQSALLLLGLGPVALLKVQDGFQGLVGQVVMEIHVHRCVDEVLGCYQ